MDTLLKICSYLILAWLIFGMLYPKKALEFMKNENSKKRKNVVLFAVLAFIGCGMLFGLLEAMITPQKTQSTLSVAADTTTKAQKNEVDSVTNALLERQRQEDSITVKKLKSLFDEKDQNKACKAAYQRLRNGARGHHRDIPQEVANRNTFQADKAELTPPLFLWRERKCNQNPDMGNAHCKLVANHNAAFPQKVVEFLKFGDNGQNNADVLRGLLLLL